MIDNYRRTLRVLEMLKPDIWLAPHSETYDFEGKLARSPREGVNAWVDPMGYRQWLVAQRGNLEAAVNKELGTTPKQKTEPTQ
jgi:metallo-beta-lactamase class B